MPFVFAIRSGVCVARRVRHTADGVPPASIAYPTEGSMMLTRQMRVLLRAFLVLWLVSAVLASARGTMVHAEPVLSLSVNHR